jgi:hypothetical protein
VSLCARAISFWFFTSKRKHSDSTWLLWPDTVVHRTSLEAIEKKVIGLGLELEEPAAKQPAAMPLGTTTTVAAVETVTASRFALQRVIVDKSTGVECMLRTGDIWKVSQYSNQRADGMVVLVGFVEYLGGVFPVALQAGVTAEFKQTQALAVEDFRQLVHDRDLLARAVEWLAPLTELHRAWPGALEEMRRRLILEQQDSSSGNGSSGGSGIGGNPYVYPPSSASSDVEVEADLDLSTLSEEPLLECSSSSGYVGGGCCYEERMTPEAEAKAGKSAGDSPVSALPSEQESRTFTPVRISQMRPGRGGEKRILHSGIIWQLKNQRVVLVGFAGRGSVAVAIRETSRGKGGVGGFEVVNSITRKCIQAEVSDRRLLTRAI